MNTAVFQTRVLLLILSPKTVKSNLRFLKEKTNRYIKRINISVSYITENLL